MAIDRSQALKKKILICSNVKMKQFCTKGGWKLGWIWITGC